MGFNSVFKVLNHERIIHFDVAPVTVAVYSRNVPACLKFHFNVSRNYYSRYLLSKLLDTT